MSRLSKHNREGYVKESITFPLDHHESSNSSPNGQVDPMSHRKDLAMAF